MTSWLILALVAAGASALQIHHVGALQHNQGQARLQQLLMCDAAPAAVAESNDNAASRIAVREKFWMEFEIPKKGIAEYGTAQVRLAPLLESSTLIKVEYNLPFGLSAEPKDGRAVVTKAGEGGEQPGDLLRFFSAWKVRDGAPIGSPDLVDVNQVMNRILPNGMVVPREAEGWEQVIAKLCTNDGSFGESMVMLFERPT
eukprot:CAMPEP_0181251042 /NCGR_PEP_ID=MMETSP1096-20121128/46654_1 /TAXON_ID=156174 ORGANISM="Chrysochromulina ericina, Strain CCMP281" /NCGR_SAMPLE_ID=MMETSP1096 /ASSEMBLY_ACC=CAM_ASM_000453 /LENGTH=199 /DNA_ID=CAMNT_0023348575 /DNA_START=16 /DNA_END=615 /DNA_ORIENTATION=+